jgi:predicted acetyltransferase
MTKSPLLVRATQADAKLLENLLELYIHDMSEFLPLQPGADGRFGYPRLALYWSEPATRHAFLIQSERGVAGFALVMRGSPASDDPEVLDVAEFFVLRGHRRSGIGRAAAMALWDELPGSWIVRVSQANRAGIPFWSEVVRAYTGGSFVERTLPENPAPRRVLTFQSRARTARA